MKTPSRFFILLLIATTLVVAMMGAKAPAFVNMKQEVRSTI